jgi:hypothetical protein
MTPRCTVLPSEIENGQRNTLKLGKTIQKRKCKSICDWVKSKEEKLETRHLKVVVATLATNEYIVIKFKNHLE